MSKKYLSLEEAAQALGISTEELNKARDKGDLRGFADRSSWKFRAEDVTNYGRSLGTDSAPEVPIMDEGLVTDEDPSLSDSASDVRLILDDDLMGDDSDPDVVIPEEKEKAVDSGSDSDVRLASDDSGIDKGSDSDVRLMDDEGSNVLGADADESTEPAEGLTLTAGSSILGGDDESGISLEAADSGISLEAADSGISLESLDSGINLSAEDSDAGFSLDDQDDSGISLDDGGDENNRTVTMDAVGPDSDMLLDDTQFEMESTGGGSSEYEISGLGDGEDDDNDTSVLLLDDEDDADEGAPTMVGGGGDDDFDSEEAFDLGDDAGGFDSFEDDDLMIEETVVGEDDEFDDMEVFDAVDEDFDDEFGDMGSAGEFAAPVGMRVQQSQETELGGGTVAGVVISSVLMLVCGLIMVDLVRSMWSFQQPATYTSGILDMIKGMF